MLPAGDGAPNRTVSWPEVHRDARELARMVTTGGGPWTGIVALTRGGLVPAAVLARELGVRLIDTLCISSYDERERQALRVLKAPSLAAAAGGRGWLVVDDLVDTGATAREARRLLPQAHLATLFAKPAGLDAVNTHVHPVAQTVWVVFPWDLEADPAPPLSRGDVSGSSDSKGPVADGFILPRESCR